MGWYEDEKNAEKIEAAIRDQTDAINNLRRQQKEQADIEWQARNSRPSSLLTSKQRTKLFIGVIIGLFVFSVVIKVLFFIISLFI